MRIETERLVLRPWRENDAAALYRYASDPEVGPSAGWAPHTSVEDSLNVLRTILMNERTWAKPFWGKGYVPEAVRALMSLYFSFGAERIWCAHADFNDRSRRVIEKVGFHYRFTAPWESSLGDVRNSLYYALEAEEFGDD